MYRFSETRRRLPFRHRELVIQLIGKLIDMANSVAVRLVGLYNAYLSDRIRVLSDEPVSQDRLQKTRPG